MKIIRKQLFENRCSKTAIRKTVIRIETCSKENYSNGQMFEVIIIRNERHYRRRNKQLFKMITIRNKRVLEMFSIIGWLSFQLRRVYLSQVNIYR